MADPVILTVSLKISYTSKEDGAVRSITYDNIKAGLSSDTVKAFATALENAGHLFIPEIYSVKGASLITRTETPYEWEKN